jgi:hypothetical protein
MKTLGLILSLAITALPQTATQPQPHHQPATHSAVAFQQAIAGQTFSANFPALAGETGCGLQVFGKQDAKAGWKLSGQTFSGTPSSMGTYGLKISCTKPNSVNQIITLRVNKTAPPPIKTAPAPPTIPLN